MIEIIIGNYRASNKGSILEYLDMLSEQRQDGGLHGGHIHYIQGKSGSFILKASIKGILDNVPDIFPLDLPEQVEKNPELIFTEKQAEIVNEINRNLIMPIDGSDILEIIRLAREYMALDIGD